MDKESLLHEAEVEANHGLSYYFRRLVRSCQRFFTSFLGLHYVYFISLIILGSIIVYPQRNMSYTNALYSVTSHATQAGLNAVLFNDIKLYQQIVMYMITWLTTPIFVHSGVVFYRLYCFERHFKNIKINSKIQSKLRRTTTMARAQSKDERDLEAVADEAAGRSATSNFFGQTSLHVPFRKFPDANGNSTDSAATDDHESDDRNNAEDNRYGVLDPPREKEIRFGNLPHPTKRHEFFRPQDMRHSINILQRQRGLNEDMSEGPPLVVKSPRDLDEENERKEREMLDLRRQARRLKNVDIINSDDSICPCQTADILPVPDGTHSDPPTFSSGSLTPSILSEKQVLDDMIESPTELVSEIRNLRPKFVTTGPHLARSQSEDNSAKSKSLVSVWISKDNHDHLRKANSEDTRLGRLTSGFKRSKTLDTLLRRNSAAHNVEPTMSSNYLSWEPTVGRNSAFVGLTDAQKEELGGVEYRALKLLAKVLVSYYIGFALLGVVAFWPYSYLKKNFEHLFYSEGFSPTWWSFYTSMSAYCNVGMSLDPESYAAFQRSPYIPIWSMFLIIIGNTGFPCMLRLILWVMFKLSPRYGNLRESLGFLLDHPRRCFTLLFPSAATWWLFGVLFTLNAIDLVLFMVLDLDKGPIKAIPAGYRVMCGLFQAISTRTCGLTIVNMSDVHPAVQVSYTIMMYISVFPVAISIRRTNVYEEQSLGVYYDPEEEDNHRKSSFVATHLRKQLSYDLWFLSLGLFLLCVTEGGQLRAGVFDIFDCLFEIVSAYGTVGASMGYGNTNLALSGGFSNIGKLIIIATMIRGRHRGLPYAIDRAIMFKADKLLQADSIQSNRARNKRRMSMSVPISGTSDRNGSMASGSKAFS